MTKLKTILITGATGSFGNVCIKYLLDKYNLKKIIIFSRDELKQFEMMQKFSKHPKFKILRFFLGDVRDLERLTMAMHNVDHVIHAAALKQVPAAEYNPIEFVKTNINGAENVVKAAIHNNVQKVIALSTDKAVNPVNLYGATKLASDKIFVHSNNLVPKENKTMFSVVRYGNVVGSRGSVLPVFRSQINSKQNYFTITDKRMTRFWITLDQGVKFVMDSFKRMEGGEVFIPKCPSVKITDLAKSLDEKRKLKIIGIRPGEKIHELLISKETAAQTIDFGKFFVLLPNDTNRKLLKKKKSYFLNILNEKGKKVKNNYELSSDQKYFLSIKEIRKINKIIS